MRAPPFFFIVRPLARFRRISLQEMANMAAARGTGRLATGRFATREELTRHVWAIWRQQVYPNLKAVAHACGTTVGVVKTITADREGLGEYLEKGCPIGA